MSKFKIGDIVCVNPNLRKNKNMDGWTTENMIVDQVDRCIICKHPSKGYSVFHSNEIELVSPYAVGTSVQLSKNIDRNNCLWAFAWEGELVVTYIFGPAPERREKIKCRRADGTHGCFSPDQLEPYVKSENTKDYRIVGVKKANQNFSEWTPISLDKYSSIGECEKYIEKNASNLKNFSKIIILNVAKTLERKTKEEKIITEYWE